MSFYRTDDPVADFDRYDAEQQKALEQCPVCDECGEYIQEGYYDLDGILYCDACMDGHRKWVEI